MAETFLPKVSSPEGLAVDWVSRNIFWTDSGKTTVEVANLETKKRKVLVSDGLVNPRGIAVHPYRGLVSFLKEFDRLSVKHWKELDEPIRFSVIDKLGLKNLLIKQMEKDSN